MGHSPCSAKSHHDLMVRHFSEVEFKGGSTIVNRAEGGLCFRSTCAECERNEQQWSFHGSVYDQFLHLPMLSIGYPYPVGPPRKLRRVKMEERGGDILVSYGNPAPNVPHGYLLGRIIRKSQEQFFAGRVGVQMEVPAGYFRNTLLRSGQALYNGPWGDQEGI